MCSVCDRLGIRPCNLTDSLGNFPRRSAKAVLLRGLDLVGRVYHAGGVPILCYHSIDDSGSLLSVSPALFERQVTYLKDHGYRTLALSELCNTLIQHRPLPEKTVVLTFDDGFRNSHSIVLSTLRRFGFTATVFVTTGYVGKRMAWTKTEDVPEMEIATWDEIAEMAQGGLDIQAHTVTHPNLRHLTLDQVRQEIEESRDAIESRLNTRVDLFAYPYGEFTPEIQHLVAELGFVGAVTMDVGRTHSGDPPLALKRLNVTEVSHVGDRTRMAFFRSCMSGTSTWYSGMKSSLPKLVRHERPWEVPAE